MHNHKQSGGRGRGRRMEERRRLTKLEFVEIFSTIPQAGLAVARGGMHAD
jgi:hypothetical protein